MRVPIPPLALFALIPLAACSESGAETKTMSDPATAMEGAAAKTGGIDFAKLAPDALKAEAKTMFDDLASRLGALKDAQGAKDLVARFQPMVDQLAGMKDELAGKLPDTAAFRKAIEDCATQLQSNPEVQKVVQPLIDKLKTVIG